MRHREESKQYNVKVSDNSSEPDNSERQDIQDVYEITEEKNYFIIMDGFGDSLREVHEDNGFTFSFKTTAQIGIQLLDLLQ